MNYRWCYRLIYDTCEALMNVLQCSNVVQPELVYNQSQLEFHAGNRRKNRACSILLQKPVPVKKLYQKS
jgi:hypothetical protein